MPLPTESKFGRRAARSLGIAALLALSGCSALQVTDPQSPFFVPPPGTRVIVAQRLAVPPGYTRVFLQYGRIVPKHQLNEYAVNCNFEINTLADTTRYIEPDTFVVTRSRRETDSIVSRGPIRLASIGRLVSEEAGDDDSTMMFEEVILTLKSDRQPDVRNLACRGALENPATMALPTLAEITATLGDHARIEIQSGEGHK